MRTIFEKENIEVEKLNILGTGAAMTLDCYNTCFTLENNEGEHILVDTGGGLQLHIYQRIIYHIV